MRWRQEGSSKPDDGALPGLLQMLLAVLNEPVIESSEPVKPDSLPFQKAPKPLRMLINDQCGGVESFWRPLYMPLVESRSPQLRGHVGDAAQLSC